MDIFKIPIKFNNEIDKIIFGKLTLPIIDWGYKNNLNPNFFTTCSFAFQLYSVYLLSCFYPLGFAFYYFLGYFFDCVDGPMARKYNMATKFGDYYDHVTDIICFILVNYYLVHLYNLFNYKILVCAYCVMFYGLIKYIGLQESYYDKINHPEAKSPFLYWTKNFVTKKDSIENYNFFSFTTFALFICLLPVQIYYFNDLSMIYI